MEKILIQNQEHLNIAIEFFGKKYAAEIEKITKTKPCILIGKYSEDIDFGNEYDFSTIVLEDFNKQPGQTFY